MELYDWRFEGDGDKALKPVTAYLPKQEDAMIFTFDDGMSALLYDLDTKKLARQCQNADRYMSDDSFLYSRCAALINGPAYYEKAKNGKQKDLWSMELEALLYVPQRAWAHKHRQPEEVYPHTPLVSFETGGKTEGWK